MRIDVTQKHIDEGLPGEADGCAIVKAINEQTGLDWATDNNFAYQLDCCGRLLGDVTVTLPDAAALWGYRYDARLRIEPFSFEFPWEPAPA